MTAFSHFLVYVSTTSYKDPLYHAYLYHREKSEKESERKGGRVEGKKGEMDDTNKCK